MSRQSGRSGVKWTAERHEKFKATMAAKRAARGQEVSYAVLAKKLRAAVIQRISQTGRADSVEELALALTTAILGPRG